MIKDKIIVKKRFIIYFYATVYCFENVQGMRFRKNPKGVHGLKKVENHCPKGTLLKNSEKGHNRTYIQQYTIH